MIETCKYINHKGETLEFGKNGIFINENDLRDYQWDAETINDRIINLKRGYSSRNIPLLIYCASEKEGISVRNTIFEVFDKDVEAKEPGMIVIGDYYMKGFITESKKKKYSMSKRYLELDVTFTTDTPSWFKEKKMNYLYSANSSSSGGFDYPFDYPFDYGIRDTAESILNNEHFSECKFIIKISGYAFEPSITIGENTYKVKDVTVSEGDVLEINAKDKTITLIKENGARENKFANRDRQHYIFEPIAPGQQKVYWNGEYSWELTLIEERSEPKWI